jgi:2-polyprenyl-3-methyl-5-hydroxy-6-metoxy-1,4-benzoquinol methylase
MNTCSTSQNTSCWLCGSDTRLVRDVTLPSVPCSGDFAITDSHYGRTGSIYGCTCCGFLQCHGLDDVLFHYENLVDHDYENSRIVRGLQMKQLLKRLSKPRPGDRLLDVGAGSGILLEEAAIQQEYGSVEGVEPSRWLVQQARDRSLIVHEGVLPHEDIFGLFQTITLVDVLEHVPDPLDLLRQAESLLSPDGEILVITPDLDSLAARIMGWNWWHFRLAHIGYFNRITLTDTLLRCGLQPTQWFRPRWYFPLNYLIERINVYLPNRIRLKSPKICAKVTIPLNTWDSWGVICRKRERK